MSGPDREAERERSAFEAVFRRRMLIGFTIGSLFTLAVAALLHSSDNWVYAIYTQPVLIATPFMGALGGAIAILWGTRAKRSN